MVKNFIAGALGLGIGCGGIILLVAAMQEKLTNHLQDAFNFAFLALALWFVALAAARLFVPNVLPMRQVERAEARFTRDAPRAVRMRALALDACAVTVPLLCLVSMIKLAQTYPQQTVYPSPTAGTVFQYGDYYRYVNMALDHGDPKYVYIQPFLYRVLVPSTVHLLSHLGVPFRTGFFSITCLTLCVSTVALYFLARGAGLSRFASSCTAVVFTLLYWTVTYNVSDYFLIDTTTEAFIVTMVLCVQRRRFIPAIVLGTIGAACKETIYLPIAFAAIHLTVPYLTPLSATLGQVARLRFAAVARRVPGRNWVLLGPMIVCPLLVTLLLRLFIPLAHPKSLTFLWRIYWEAHVDFGIMRTIASSLWYTFGIMVFLALGAMALRLWPRARWSGWGLLAVLVIIVYSYLLSYDSERLSIVAWPFVLVLAALMINEIARRLRVPEFVLWPVIIVLLLLNFPPYPGVPHFDNVTYLGTRLLPQASQWPLVASLLLFATTGILLITGYLLYTGITRPGVASPPDDVAERETTRLLAH